MADIKGVEIFAVGTWNGNKITLTVLEDLVHSFEKTKGFLKPVLKLGHNSEQKLIAKDGLPAAGWVENVYIKGKKLLADFSDIPETIADLIKRRAYRKVSVEIFSGLKLEGDRFPHLLGAVALLGADTPAVLSLADIPTDFSSDGKTAPNFTIDGSLLNIDFNTYTIQIDDGDSSMADENKKEDNELSEVVENQTKVIEELKSQVDSMSQYKSDMDKKLESLELEKKKTEVEKFSLSLESQNLASPSMKPYIEALASYSKEEYSIGEKKLNVSQVVEELLKLAKEVYSINKEEKTVEGKKEDKNSFAEQNAKIEEYAAKNGVSYSQAYKIIQKK